MSRNNKIRLLLLAAILLVFGQVVKHDFVDWDDGQLIYKNQNVVHPTIGGLLNQWNPGSADNRNQSMYCPMVFTVWWSLSPLAQLDSPDLLGSTLNPYVYHAANLVVHVLCACVVLEILLRLKIGPWAAAAGALVFAVHPLQTEVVAWASAMKDLLSGLFALLAIWRYIAAIESRGKPRKWNYALSTICFAAAVLSKPSTATLPVIVGAIDLILYRRSWKDVVKWTWPWYVMAIAAAIITAAIQVRKSWVGGPEWSHPLVAMDALAFYLGKLLFPFHLNVDYGRNPLAMLNDPNHPLYWTWVFPVASGIVIWRSRVRQWWVAGLIFLLGVLPTLGLTAFAFQYFTTVADRYVYLSMLGAALGVGWWMQGHRSRAWGIAAGAVIVVLGSLSFVQAQRWTDTPTLFSYAMDNTKPLHNITMGSYQDDLAVPCLRQAEQAGKLGHYAEQKQFMDQALGYMDKAMAYYRTAIRLGPTDTQAYDLLSRDLVFLNRFPEAIEVVKQWIKYDPQSELNPSQPPGKLEGMLGVLYLKNHQYPEGAAALKRSLAEKDDPEMRKMLVAAENLAVTRPNRGK